MDALAIAIFIIFAILSMARRFGGNTTPPPGPRRPPVDSPPRPTLRELLEEFEVLEPEIEPAPPPSPAPPSPIPPARPRRLEDKPPMHKTGKAVEAEGVFLEHPDHDAHVAGLRGTPATGVSGDDATVTWTGQDIWNGIVWSEILKPPRSRRRRPGVRYN